MKRIFVARIRYLWMYMQALARSLAAVYHFNQPRFPMEIMNPEPDKSQPLDRLMKNIVGLIDTQIKLFRLEVKSEVSNAIALMAIVMVVSMMCAFVIILLSIASAMALGRSMGNRVSGYVIVAGAYALLLPIIIGFNKPIQRKIANAVDEQIKKLEEDN